MPLLLTRSQSRKSPMANAKHLRRHMQKSNHARTESRPTCLGSPSKSVSPACNALLSTPWLSRSSKVTTRGFSLSKKPPLIGAIIGRACRLGERWYPLLPLVPVTLATTKALRRARLRVATASRRFSSTRNSTISSYDIGAEVSTCVTGAGNTREHIFVRDVRLSNASWHKCSQCGSKLSRYHDARRVKDMLRSRRAHLC